MSCHHWIQLTIENVRLLVVSTLVRCGFCLRLMCAIKAKLLRNSIEEMFMKTYISAAFPPPLHAALVCHPSTQGKPAVQPPWTAVAARWLFGDAGADGRMFTISFCSYI